MNKTERAMNLKTNKHALDSYIRIAVVEDYRTYRKGLVHLLNQQEEIEVVLEEHYRIAAQMHFASGVHPTIG